MENHDELSAEEIEKIREDNKKEPPCLGCAWLAIDMCDTRCVHYERESGL